MISLHFDGTKALLAELDKLDARVRKRGIRRAVTAAARPVRAAYQGNVPVLFGWLRYAIDLKVKTYRETAVAVVGARSDVSAQVPSGFGGTRTERPSKYAAIIELGAKPHLIPAGRHFGTGLEAGSKIQHPGIYGRNPLRKALESTRDEVERILIDKLTETVERARD
jgi:hypothetical protein